MAPPQRTENVYLLPLTDSGAPDVPGTYIFLPPPTNPHYIIRFEIQGASSICRGGSLWVNIPGKDEDFRRDNYKEYKLQMDFNGTNSIDVAVHKAGAFSFYCTYLPLPEFDVTRRPSPKQISSPTYYIDICPNLTLQGSQLPLDSIAMISCLSKFMGKYPEDWDRHLNGISQREYNMIHFTPLMMRGSSNSPYSIYDQLCFDKEIFPKGEKDIADLTNKMEKEYGLLALTDVVWNHTAHNSKWLEEHPEAGYNINTAPWLESAFACDSALLKFGDQLAELDLPVDIKTEDDLKKIMDGIKNHVISKLKLWEFYVCNMERDVPAILEAWRAGTVEFPENHFGERGFGNLDELHGWSDQQKVDWVIENCVTGLDHLGERFRRRIDPVKCASLLSILHGRFDTRTKIAADEQEALNLCKKMAESINLQFYKEWDQDYKVMMEQLQNRIKYVRLDEHGPKLGPIDKKNPLIESYFTRLPLNSVTKQHDPRSLALVNNGWIWAADAMRDNAGPKSRAYLRREVIIWGDCVKLRYGSGPQDNPYLWDRIAKYTRLMAKHFCGFRIDNCHSTPMHLAQYMLDQARLVRPDLLVCAELFTGSEEMDFRFCKELGISCLIREAMQAWNTQEMSRLVHRHAGVPIGSFETDEVINMEKANNGSNGAKNSSSSATKRENIHLIKKSPVHALFTDCTHDNEPPAQKRDARDTLSNAALVSMCACATGSVFGYDECYPRLIELVHETRPYSSPYSNRNQIKIQSSEGGIGNIKRILNKIHWLMGKDSYTETYLHHDNEYITIHRVHPQSRKGYFLIAHTAYPGYGNGNGGFGATKLPGTKAKCVGSWSFQVDSSDQAKTAAIEDQTLRGIPCRTKEIRGVTCEYKNGETEIRVPENFPPGSIALFETWIPGAEHSEGIDKFVCSGADEACKKLSLTDLNVLLYRCDPEERDNSGGDGCYSIPGHGPLVYAGIQGWWSPLREIVRDNNLGHAICDHLRSGNWALDYCVGRLDKAAKQKGFENLKDPADWLRDRFAACRKLPSFLIPRYFAMVIQTIYTAAIDRCMEVMSPTIRNSQDFVQKLALVSVQVTSIMKTTSLWPDKSVACLAAGLPHFASDWARCWGRDIMISVPGSLMAVGRYDDAKEHILAFGSVVKHGMIPNLLSSGKLPRYNSRDSVWFFMQCIQEYCKRVPNGISLLQTPVRRRFLPYDDAWFAFDDPRAYSKKSTIAEIMQEVMQRHAVGLHFREFNAGPDLDQQMKSEGFNIDIWTDKETGFIHGGNQFNCGTWMDKMGESEKAGSKGVPGTPRDGAAVEITGMCYSACKWLGELHQTGKFKYSGVIFPDKEAFSYSEWAGKIKKNFERCYYVPGDRSEDSKYDIDSSVVNRREIYKDLYKSGKPYEDYQLRPNFAIAMCTAPDLFDRDHALRALHQADKILRGPVGMRTLDPSDLNYRPFYNNGEDSTDFHTSKGRNYHQGPEWVWPLGFHLQALLHFHLLGCAVPDERIECYQQITRRLAGCRDMITTSAWAGLTELTNKDGAFCADSCPTQAWSAACLMDVFEKAGRLEKLDESEAGLAGKRKVVVADRNGVKQ